jgi:hypothetical protein
MKKNITSALLASCLFGLAFSASAGNKDRTGQSGAAELNINPWARSTGLFAINTSTVYGMEAMKSNVAGLALDTALEIGFSHGIYLTGTNISVNNFAIAQKIGDIGVLGLNIMSMGFGDIPVTDYYNPEGYGSYSPQFLNFQLAYAKRFSTHISAGFSATFVTEQISNIGASGAAFDGGVQYVTGKHDNFHFGVTLRNIGTNMRFSGTGFAVNGDATQSTPAFSVTTQYPSEKFEMPTYLNIGAAYDFYFDGHSQNNGETAHKHKLTAMMDFQSNSFNNDYIGLGGEYSFMNMLFLRAAYRYENGIGDPATSTTLYQGFAAGVTLQKRLGETGPVLALDYSYRPTQRPANGVQMFGIRLSR